MKHIFDNLRPRNCAEIILGLLLIIVVTLLMAYTFTDPATRSFMQQLFDHHCAPGAICL